MLARRITSGQFWWFILLAAVVLPTAASLLDFAVYRMTGDPAYAPIQLTYETIGPLAMVQMSFGTGLIARIVFWVALIPILIAAARRLNDTGRSAAWLLLLLVPIIGWFILLVWWTNRSDPETNAYGPPPVTTHRRFSAVLAIVLLAASVASWIWITRVVTPPTPTKPAITAQAFEIFRPAEA